MVIGVILGMVILNDYMDFMKEKMVGQLVLKIVISLVIIGAFFMMKGEFSKESDRLQDEMYQEKVKLKKAKKNLTGFNTRILSQIRASPAGFAKILT